MHHNGRAKGLWTRFYHDVESETLRRIEPGDVALVLIFLLGIVLFILPRF
jgi:hypothetical protein